MNTMQNLNTVVTATITPADIQCKHTIGDSCDTRVRKSWVLQMPEEQKAKFENFPMIVKTQLYRSFDYEVQGIWVKLMMNARIEAEKAGAKYVKVAGISRLEDEFCVNTDELLILAAQMWLDDFATRQANSNS